MEGILIISGPRTGSTYLGNELSKNYDFKFISEPREIKHLKKAKCIKLIPFKTVDYTLDDIVDFSKRFSNIILLQRKDKIAQAESWQALHGMKYLKQGDHLKWQVGTIEPKYPLEFYVDKVKYLDEKIEWLSKKLNIPISFYEDIYYEGKVPYDLIFKPDLSKRLRQEQKKKKQRYL
jgi:hypothetical protein